MNKDLRKIIAKMVQESGEGHIPSSYSIVDIIEFLYGRILKYDSNQPKWNERDYFILSKGHGCGALYAVLHKYGFISNKDILEYSTSKGILGGHPDMTKVPGVEASTGSLGHGFPTAVGLALGLRIQKQKNRVFVLLGDGECHEGPVWEAANVGNNLELGNLCAIIDWNGSAAQLMSKDNLLDKWKSFGWKCYEMDGHSSTAFKETFSKIKYNQKGQPNVILSKNVKGKGVSFLEGHGIWHHKIPNADEMKLIIKELEE